MSTWFLLDENLGSAIRDGLKRLDPRIEISAVGDEGAPPLGTPDPSILCWLEERGCCLVTNNRKSMPPHLGDHLSGGRHVPGLFVLRPEARLGAVIEDLYLVWLAGVPGQFIDRITYLPLQPVPR